MSDPDMHILLYLLRSGNYTEADVDEIGTLKGKFDQLSICVGYQDLVFDEVKRLLEILDATEITSTVESVSLHFLFDHFKSWESYSAEERKSYSAFLKYMAEKCGPKVEHFSCVSKYIDEQPNNADLSAEVNADLSLWTKVHTLDYGLNQVGDLSLAQFPDSVQTLNIGGSRALTLLTGIKWPSSLSFLDVSHSSISSIDYVVFPSLLQRLNLLSNKIYFLNYVDFPQGLQALDLLGNRIDTLQNVNFPRNLKYLSVALNPIECIKGARFPESIEYLDVLCIPNESMAGFKFPDATVLLNLQQSMTNTRGLKFPPFVRELNLAGNGVNSINPLRLPNSIEKLFLANNNIKTLNKVLFPTALRELYLGNNMITTLKNVQFPSTLEVLDVEMDPHNEDNEKCVTSLKDVFLPNALKVLRLGYHAIKTVETMEFPYHLEELSLQYNDLRVFRNVRFGPNLRVLDLSGNQDLQGLENVVFPESLAKLKVPSGLLSNLPAAIVERANKHELEITKSLPVPI